MPGFAFRQSEWMHAMELAAVLSVALGVRESRLPGWGLSEGERVACARDLG